MNIVYYVRMNVHSQVHFQLDFDQKKEASFDQLDQRSDASRYKLCARASAINLANDGQLSTCVPGRFDVSKIVKERVQENTG